jgi:hypothetical protein
MRCVAELFRTLIKAAPLRGAGPGVSARLSLDEARLAHAGPPAGLADQGNSYDKQPVGARGRLPRLGIVQLAAPR